MSGLLAPSHRAAPAGTPVGGSGLNVGIFRVRQRCRPAVGAAIASSTWWYRDTADLIFCGLTCALLLGVFGAFLIRLLHAPPVTVATVVLLLLLALSLRPPSWNLRNFGKFLARPPRGTCLRGADNSSRFERVPLEANRTPPGLRGCGALPCGRRVGDPADAQGLTPPPELSIAQSTRSPPSPRYSWVRSVPCRPSSRSPKLGKNKVVWHTNLAKTTGVQKVDLPADLLHKGSRVELLARGQDVRWVNGWVEIEPPPTAGSSVRF